MMDEWIVDGWMDGWQVGEWMGEWIERMMDGPGCGSASSLPALLLLGTWPTFPARPATASPMFLHILQMQPPTKGPSSATLQVPRSTYQLPEEQQMLEMTKRYNRRKAEVSEMRGAPGSRVTGSGEGAEGC